MDAFEDGLGIPLGGPNEQAQDEVKRLLSLGTVDLTQMNEDQCGEAAVVLMNFAFHLQRCTNREQARANWAEETLKKIISKTLPRQSGGSYEERRLLAVSASEQADSLDRTRIRARAKADALAFQAQRIDSLSKALMALKQTRRKYA